MHVCRFSKFASLSLIVAGTQADKYACAHCCFICSKTREPCRCSSLHSEVRCASGAVRVSIHSSVAPLLPVLAQRRLDGRLQLERVVGEPLPAASPQISRPFPHIDLEVTRGSNSRRELGGNPGAEAKFDADATNEVPLKRAEGGGIQVWSWLLLCDDQPHVC